MTRDLETESRQVLAALRAPISVPAPSTEETERKRALSELESMIRKLPVERACYRAQQRRHRWYVALPAAAALLLAVGAAAWFGVPKSSSPGPAAQQSGATLIAGSLVTPDGRVVTSGERFGEAGAMRTPEGQSALVLTEAGVQLTFAPASRATVSGAQRNQRFVLEHGQLSLDVPPLPEGQRLSVVTPDATVVVHGTRFSVTYDESRTTCVRVTEGRVLVQRIEGHRLVGAGEMSGCGEPEPKSPTATDDTTTPSPTTTARPLPKRSTLAQQNRLMRAGLEAERVKDWNRAEANLTTLLRRYPETPFKTEAQRVLARVRQEREAD